MIVVTSLSPGHTNCVNQHIALNSWGKIADKIYSLNTAQEIEKIGDEYKGVSLVETSRTVEALIGKPLISINALIDFAKEKGDDLLLINSDIILDSLPELKMDGVTIFSRFDYTNSFEEAKKFEYGFDVFHVPYKFLNIFPPGIYALGAAWHDYATCYRVILNNIPLYYPQEKYAYHKLHETQYSVDEWYHLGKYFRFEFRLNEQLSIENVATAALANIRSRLRKI